MLCLACQEIFRYISTTIGRYSHTKLTKLVYKAQRDGCQICYMLCRHFKTDIHYQPVAELDLYYTIQYWGEKDPLFLHFDYLTMTGDSVEECLKIYQIDEWAAHLSMNKSSVPENQKTSITNTSSEKSLGQARAWLHDCSTTHKHCNLQLSHKKWWPTRLIEIADSNVLGIRLIETADSKPSEPYLTLSHCWGAADFIRLTTENIEELKTGIAMDVLPKTFQDAISVTKSLRFRYIWIDSLCIVQNSVPDWTQEATVMSDVYQHATCNIAATHASDSSKGLFTNRIEPLQCIVQASRSYSPRLEPKDFHVLDPDLWSDCVENTPLLRRGWVVQERLLARRVLHFARGELFWECREKRACETYPERMPEATLQRAIPKDLTLVPDSLLMWEEKWSSILAWYSSTRLTKSEDKEAALYGIIKVLSKTFDDTCVVGLWVKVIYTQLLWHYPKETTVERAGRAPSWSWMSLDGFVSPGQGGTQVDYENWEVHTVDLKELSITRKGSSPVSPFVTGFLTLQGMLHPVRWRASDQTGSGDRVPVLLDFHQLQRPLKVSADGFLDDENTASTASLPGTSYFCVSILLQGSSEGKLNHSQGLILELLAGGKYKRVGYFKVDSRYSHDKYRPGTQLVSRRRQGLYDTKHQKRKIYKHYPFEVSYSADGCETKVSRGASGKEIHDRQADAEEVVFTII